MTTNDAPIEAQRTTAFAKRQPDRFFKPDREMNSNRGVLMVEGITLDLMGYEEEYCLRKRARKPQDSAKFNRAVEALICDLAVQELSEDYRGTAIPRRKADLSATSPYNPWYYCVSACNFDPLPGVIGVQK